MPEDCVLVVCIPSSCNSPARVQPGIVHNEEERRKNFSSKFRMISWWGACCLAFWVVWALGKTNLGL
eukprot:5870167-Amphidinium_carterae.1